METKDFHKVLSTHTFNMEQRAHSTRDMLMVAGVVVSPVVPNSAARTWSFDTYSPEP